MDLYLAATFILIAAAIGMLAGHVTGYAKGREDGARHERKSWEGFYGDD